MVAAIVTYVSFNAIIKKAFEVGGPRIAKVETRLGGVAIIPFTGSGKLEGIVIGNPEGAKTPYAIKVDSIHTQLVPASIRTQTIVIESVKIANPDIYIEGGLTGKNNLTTILGNIQSFAGSPEHSKPRETQEGIAEHSATPPEGKKAIIKDLLITGAKLHWVSSLALGQEVAMPLPEIHLTNLGEKNNGMALSQVSSLLVAEVSKTATLALKQKHWMGSGVEAAVSAAFPTSFHRP